MHVQKRGELQPNVQPEHMVASKSCSFTVVAIIVWFLVCKMKKKRLLVMETFLQRQWEWEILPAERLQWEQTHNCIAALCIVSMKRQPRTAGLRDGKDTHHHYPISWKSLTKRHHTDRFMCQGGAIHEGHDWDFARWWFCCDCRCSAKASEASMAKHCPWDPGWVMHILKQARDRGLSSSG